MNETKIPKIIHYCWFGGNPKPDLVLKCIESWKKVMPDYEIKEWNESNFDVNYNNYTQKAYKEKKWAFVSDVARLVALKECGGIYLDTDMYVLKNLDPLLVLEAFLGKEDDKNINAAIYATRKDNIFLKDLLETYAKERSNFETIPRIMTELYYKNRDKYSNVKVFDKKYFYPFSQENIKKFNYKNAPQESYAVHLWNYSWGNSLNKFIKKIGLHSLLKKITEKLKIKNFLKKILKIT